VSLNVNTRPAVENPTTPEDWINDETAAAARALWEKNPKASQIECALIAATHAIRPMRRQVLESVVEGGAQRLHDESGARPLKWADRPEGAKDFWRAKMRRALGIGNRMGEPLGVEGEGT